MSKKRLELSSPFVFFAYTAACFLIVTAFRMVYPGRNEPLPIYTFQWRFYLGLIDFITLFPAIAFAGLVIPFGFKPSENDGFSRFSLHFLEQVKNPVFSAIGAAALYGLLFLLILPLAQRGQADMSFEAYLFKAARERALEEAAEEAWPEAAQFLAICERIWPNSPQTEYIRTEVSIGLEELRLAAGALQQEAEENNSAAGTGLGIPGHPDPVDSAEALGMARLAFEGERYFDAHWLATLAGRLAGEGSAEGAQAAVFASRAWNMLA
ncbi:hypothetical protein LJC14_02745, partial [Treponema sp. OttesenSCG-928-L16]|nr:hypothetical protein [Treponema sp. OttesenSCG-928-L16]